MSHEAGATAGAEREKSPKKEAVLVMSLPLFRNCNLNRAAVSEGLSWNAQVVGPADGAFLGPSFAKTQGLGSFHRNTLRVRVDGLLKATMVTLRLIWSSEPIRDLPPRHRSLTLLCYVCYVLRNFLVLLLQEFNLEVSILCTSQGGLT